MQVMKMYETMAEGQYEVSYYALMGATYDNLGAYLPDLAYDDYGSQAFHEGDNALEENEFLESNQQKNEELA